MLFLETIAWRLLWSVPEHQAFISDYPCLLLTEAPLLSSSSLQLILLPQVFHQLWRNCLMDHSAELLIICLSLVATLPCSQLREIFSLLKDRRL